jgi:hypothetical protein
MKTSVVDPDPGGHISQKLKKLINLIFCNFVAEGFSCSLDVLYGGLGISKLHSINFGHKTLDPDSVEVLDLDLYPTGYNESGSTTLMKTNFRLQSPV